MATGTIPMEKDVLLTSQWAMANIDLLNTVTIAAKTAKSGTYNIAKSGYIPYSIVGYRIYNSTNGGVNCSCMRISQLRLNNNTITYQLYNTWSSNAVINFYVQVLYIKG